MSGSGGAGDGPEGADHGWQPPQGPAAGGWPAGAHAGPQAAGPPRVWAPAQPAHPSATTVLVLGILGLVLCQVLAPFAWIKGSSALREINAQPGRWSGRDQVQTGRVLGMVGSIILGVALAGLLVMLVMFLLAAGAVVTIGA